MEEVLTKRFFVCVVVFCLLLGITFEVWAAGNAVTKRGTTRTDTHLLQSAATGSPSRAKVPRGSKVAVLGYVKGFYRVGFNDLEGYIIEQDLIVKQVAEQFKGRGEINADDVKVRAKDNINSAIVTILTKKTQVTISEKNGNWYKVDTSRHQGYVHSDYLDIFEVDKADCCVELKMGMSGSLVQQLQTALKEAGYFKAECNGIFGARTREAVKRFQKANALQETGIADYETQALLLPTK